MSSRKQRQQATSAKWLAIVGIGEDGLAGLGENARRLISEAEFVFGGRRHLALAGEAISGEALAWPTPFDPEMKDVLALRGRRVCVLASGDPFLHGVGATLARHVPSEEVSVVPAPSAFSLAAARLGWSLPDIETLSLHGRQVELIRPHLHPGRRILALTSGSDGPAEIAALLQQEGFGRSHFTVLEALGGPRERISTNLAKEIALAEIDSLNLVAIEVEADAKARIVPLTPGLADEMFEHDGQITKREVRAVTISALAPRRGELLWDIGAGCGSVAIEWMLRDPSLQAIAVEEDAERAARIRRNSRALGVPSLKVVEGTAPKALEGLPTPDSVFVGGGGSEPDLLQAAIDALRAGGRFVANAVTLETEAMLLDLRDSLGGALTRFAVHRAEPVGSMTGWRPAMPVTQWVWEKPFGETS